MVNLGRRRKPGDFFPAFRFAPETTAAIAKRIYAEETASPQISHRGSRPQPKDSGTPRAFGRL
jgi:hypothetical protein